MSLIDRLDSAESAFFLRELESIKAQTYDIRYPELKARDFIPVSGEASEGSETVTYRQFDRRGKAKLISNNAKDVPRVDVLGEEFSRPFRQPAAAYGYTVMEAKAAAEAQRPLNAQRASAARRAVEELIDEVACFGAPDSGIESGFLNSPDVPQQAVPNPGSGTEWVNKSAQEILDDVSAAVQRVVNVTLGVEVPDTILLPTQAHALIATTPRSTTSDTTILSYILANFPMINAIEPWYRLDTAGAGDTGRMVVYKRAMETLQQEISMEFTSLPVQEQGLEFVVHNMASTAGTALYYPKAIDYSDAIQ